MTGLEPQFLFLLFWAFAVVAVIIAGAFFSKKDLAEVVTLKRDRTFWVRRFLFERRRVGCIIRQARRWKDEWSFTTANRDFYKAKYFRVMRRWIDAEKRCIAEVQANNRAFDAGVRAHATGVVNYTGDEPEGVRL